jgi:hypothetical protein
VTQPATSAYLRFPHLRGELVAFTAEDDVWLAPLDGGRAWRVSADNVPVTHPRISPDGTTVAWTSARDGAPEVHIAPVDGGPSRRLTHWGSARTQVRGWTPDGEGKAERAQGVASRGRSSASYKEFTGRARFWLGGLRQVRAVSSSRGRRSSNLLPEGEGFDCLCPRNLCRSRCCVTIRAPDRHARA